MITTGCEDEVMVELGPIHRIDSFGLAFIDGDDWAFLVAEVPDFELFLFLVIVGDCDLG
jgi:hypothetical protein